MSNKATIYSFENPHIAKFMGEQKLSDCNGFAIGGKPYHDTQLEYHDNWNWIMPVVNKIANIIKSGDFKHWSGYEQQELKFKQTNMLTLNQRTLYWDIVYFIEWYNINKL